MKSRNERLRGPDATAGCATNGQSNYRSADIVGTTETRMAFRLTGTLPLVGSVGDALVRRLSGVANQHPNVAHVGASRARFEAVIKCVEQRERIASREVLVHIETEAAGARDSVAICDGASDG